MSNSKGQHTVEKIGGTSMSATETLLANVLIGERRGRDLYGRIFVVSAFSGVTDRLLEKKKTGEPGVYALFAGAEAEERWSDALSRVGDRMRAINHQVLEEATDRLEADAFVTERVEGVRTCLHDLQRLCSLGPFRLEEHLSTIRELVSALGEAHAAKTTALLLRRRGVNARFIDLTGWRDDSHPCLDERILAGLQDVDVRRELPIVSGYAHCRDGLMRSYDRGYSEVTFSRLAVLSGAREAIIHKEFHLCSADPKIVGLDQVRVIGRTNYDVADQLANMGMEAIHPRAAKGLRQAGIPLRVKNTFEPDDDGTLILNDMGRAPARIDIVTGLRSLFALQFFEQDMVGVKGYDAAILEALKRHKVRIVTKSSNANTITHFLEGAMKAVRRVERDLAERYPSAVIDIRKVALVSVIGRDLAVPRLAMRSLRALSEAGVEPLGMHDLLRSVDLQFMVNEEDYETAITALHHALVGKEEGGEELSDARPRVAKLGHAA